MQTRMFVFIGFHNDSSDASLNSLQENLNNITKPFLTFARKEDLLFARCEEMPLGLKKIPTLLKKSVSKNRIINGWGN
jgi:hypothetical protein